MSAAVIWYDIVDIISFKIIDTELCVFGESKEI